MAAFGAPTEVIDAMAGQSDTDFGVWPENADILVMFMRLQTQWNVIPGGFIGLNYQSAEFLFRIHNVPNVAEMMDDLQAMEIAALQVMNQRKD